MPTSVACPKCERSFQVPPELLGKRMRCLQCQHVFVTQAGPPLETALQSVPSPARRPSEPPPEEEEPLPRIEVRIHRTHHDVPGYMWAFAALPWGLLLLALGGCVWGLAAGLAAVVLCGAGVALIQARRLSVGVRLVGLLVLDGLAGLLLIVGVVALALALSHGSKNGPGPAAGPNQEGRGAAYLTPAPDVPLPPVRPLFAHEPRVYLADLEEFGVQAGPWPFGNRGLNGDGQPIRVKGTRSPKGLSMHPPRAPGYASVRYRLGKQAALFRAVVAINDTSKWCWSPAIFTVLGDGKLLWQSVWIAHNHTHSESCSVDVSSVDVLELRVHCVNGSDGDHAVWIEPRLLRKADTPDK